MTKSAIAFRFTVDGFLGERKRVYMWTFTMPVKCCPRVTSAAWNRFLSRWKRTAALPLIRVYEWHWRNGHGMHVHFVLLERFPVELMRRMAEAVGFGRINVIRVDGETAKNYLAKYLRKSMGSDRPDAMRGMRLWGCYSVEGKSRVADIEKQGILADSMRYFLRSENRIFLDDFFRTFGLDPGPIGNGEYDRSARFRILRCLMEMWKSRGLEYAEYCRRKNIF